MRKLGDSNPRYGCPYVSLANWWFQPLTQTSFPHLFSNAVQKYNIFRIYKGITPSFFNKMQIFLIFEGVFSLNGAWSYGDSEQFFGKDGVLKNLFRLGQEDALVRITGGEVANEKGAHFSCSCNSCRLLGG